ncbi:MAG: DUF58 domain-containing protein [Candidatus Thiodiazotropha sp. (ex Ustalcina ferruginea)]|nr:DUF58 domain-containing protein [Candidatus Thiodiazotropha sp. (ex Ustalcina ferruginea)]
MTILPSPVIADANSDGDLPVPQQGGHDEFATVREYTHGDGLRNIHWRASARRQQLVVKEYERSDRPVLLVVLDCRPGFNQGEGARSTFEYAISIAASMIHFASRDGIQSILVVENGAWHDRIIPAYCSDLYDLYAFLARLESNNGHQSSAALTEQALRKFPQANIITGYYDIYALDGHAWVEAYVDNLGWLEFEPDAYNRSPYPCLKGPSSVIFRELMNYWAMRATSDRLG